MEPWKFREEESAPIKEKEDRRLHEEKVGFELTQLVIDRNKN